MLAQRIRVAQSRSQCDLLHRQIGELQQFLGGVQTLRQQSRCSAAPPIDLRIGPCWNERVEEWEVCASVVSVQS